MAVSGVSSPKIGWCVGPDQKRPETAENGKSLVQRVTAVDLRLANAVQIDPRFGPSTFFYKKSGASVLAPSEVGVKSRKSDEDRVLKV